MEVWCGLIRAGFARLGAAPSHGRASGSRHRPSGAGIRKPTGERTRQRVRPSRWRPTAVSSAGEGGRTTTSRAAAAGPTSPRPRPRRARGRTSRRGRTSQAGRHERSPPLPLDDNRIRGRQRDAAVPAADEVLDGDGGADGAAGVVVVREIGDGPIGGAYDRLAGEPDADVAGLEIVRAAHRSPSTTGARLDRSSVRARWIALFTSA
jgi:hypothetical protein